jgi:hypothetical protein
MSQFPSNSPYYGITPQPLYSERKLLEQVKKGEELRKAGKPVPTNREKLERLKDMVDESSTTTT